MSATTREYTKEEQKQIAETILTQLGGHIRPMLGAYNIFACEDGALSFRFKARAANGANYCKIILMGSDTYKMEFVSIRAGKFKSKGQFEDLHDDMLIRTFQEATGLSLILPRIFRV